MTEKAAKKEKTITEVFYDEWDNEIRPDDPEYKKYIDGEEYYGSYFIDEDGNVVKDYNPSREEDLEKKRQKREGKPSEEESARKTMIWAIIVMLIVSAIIAWGLLIKK